MDDGAIRYDLDRRRCGAAGQTVTILPPGVALDDPPLRAALARLHDALRQHAESLATEARLALIGERITSHLTQTPAPAPAPDPGVAGQLRLLLDEHLTSQLSLAWAAGRRRPKTSRVNFPGI